MKTLERQGASIAYAIRGDGPPVLLCHGLLGDGRLWDAVSPALEGRYRLIIPDLRGHRHSPASEGFTLWTVADDLRAIMDAEQLERAQVVGFSMGGMAALRLALAAPERVAGLGLLDTSPWPEPFLSRMRNLGMGHIVRFAGPLRAFEGIAAGLMFSPAFRAEHPDAVEATLAAYRAHGGASLSRAIRAVFKREAIVERLSEIKAPTLVVVGEIDLLTPPSCARRIARSIAGSQLEILPGAAHTTPVERPEAIARLLNAFLAA